MSSTPGGQHFQGFAVSHGRGRHSRYDRVTGASLSVPPQTYGESFRHFVMASAPIAFARITLTRLIGNNPNSHCLFTDFVSATLLCPGSSSDGHLDELLTYLQADDPLRVTGKKSQNSSAPHAAEPKAMHSNGDSCSPGAPCSRPP